MENGLEKYYQKKKEIGNSYEEVIWICWNISIRFLDLGRLLNS